MQKRTIIFITIGLIIGIYTVASEKISSPQQQFLLISPLLAQNQYEIELLRLTNIQRQKAGLLPLQMSSQLNQAAKVHAVDLVKHQFVSHTGSDGLNPSKRAQNAGYFSNYIGENIAVGRLNPTETLQGWMDNSQHRSNILNRQFSDVGLAYIHAPETEYHHYWVQVFGKKNSAANSFPIPINLSREQVPDPSQNSSQTPADTSNTQDCRGEKILSALVCPGDNLSAEENKLYELINQYRTQQGLSSIPLSPSLNRVANRHLQDLQENLQLYDRNGQDWHFGWSNCSYDANNSNTFACMWAAPQRLKTAYSDRAYEVICGGKGEISAQEALECWQKSSSNNDVIINQGEWINYEWNAIGISINGGYATLWFGQAPDRNTQSPNPPKPLPKPGRIW